jgi:hypothetical protein
VQAIGEQTNRIIDALARPVLAVIDWGQDDDANLESRRDERAAVRKSFTA